MRTFFTTFADHSYKSIDRIRKEAKESGFFDYVIVGHEDLMFESWYLKKYKNRFSDRGFGFWQWKSYIIRSTLQKMDEDDILVYLDAGCTINNEAKDCFERYKNLLSKNAAGILLFDHNLKETQWTKGDVFKYFDALSDNRYLQHNQISASVILIRKCISSALLIEEWFYLSHNKYSLLDDTPSDYPNFPDFIEHRFDQSLLSMLSVKYGACEISGEEIYTPDSNWTTQMKKFPFWVTRYRQKKRSLARRIISYIIRHTTNFINHRG